MAQRKLEEARARAESVDPPSHARTQENSALEGLNTEVSGGIAWPDSEGNSVRHYLQKVPYPLLRAVSSVPRWTSEPDEWLKL